MRRILLVLIAISCILLDARAQTGNCYIGVAEAELNAGSVRAGIYNNGMLFYNGGRASTYEVPKGSGVHAAFFKSLVVAGLIDGELRGAAPARLQGHEFWPGPLDANGNAPTDCSMYDRIWEIRSEDIEGYDANGTISSNLADWPWELGAPVIDGDGIEGNYNLEGGDRPELLGDQRLWWIMNDRGNIHSTTRSEPLGLEVEASAFAFEDFLSSVTFYRYEITYHGAKSMTDVYAGFSADGDVGDSSDDFAGADTLLDMGFVYNSSNEDEFYGSAPPAIGFMLTNTPLAPVDFIDNDNDLVIDEPGEQLGMTGLGCAGFWGWQDCDLCDVESRVLERQYNCIRGLNSFGYIIGEGDVLYTDENQAFLESNPPTPFNYPGDPVTNRFWSAVNHDLNGERMLDSDRSFSIGTGPFQLEQGDSFTLDVAAVWARGDNYLNSISELRRQAVAVRKNIATIYSMSSPSSVDIDKPATFALAFNQNYPNPFSNTTTFRYSVPTTMNVLVEVYDLLGRKIETLVQAEQTEGIYNVVFDGSDLPTGVYLARSRLGDQQFVHQMTIIR